MLRAIMFIDSFGAWHWSVSQRDVNDLLLLGFEYHAIVSY